MASYLSLIMDTPEGDADVLTPEALGDATPQGGLPHPWRAVEADDGGLHIPLELQYRQMLQDTLLDALQTIVLAVEELGCLLEVKVILAIDAPGQIYDRAQVLHLDRVVRALWVELLGLA